MQKIPFYAITTAQVIAGVALLWLLFLWQGQGQWDWQRGVGTALTLIGMTGIAVARYQLGRSFAIRAEAKQLVTHGLYSRIRNPIYMFGSVFIAGLTLVLHRPSLWFLLAFIVIVQTLRAQREARVLEAAFGDAYRDYRRKTWF